VRFSGAAVMHTHTHTVHVEKDSLGLVTRDTETLGLIVESREIVLHGADARKLIVKAPQGSMC